MYTTKACRQRVINEREVPETLTLTQLRSSLTSDPLPVEAGCETCYRIVVLLVFIA